MKKHTYELKPLDIFKHLNGSNYQVKQLWWKSGDDYRLVCVDKDNKLATFTVDVHTSFDIIYSLEVEKGTN